MQIQEYQLHTTPNCKQAKTPSTSGRECDKFQHKVSEFSFDYDLAGLSNMMNSVSFQDKQNQKHVTDRFIPIRKAYSMEEKMQEDIETLSQNLPKRGQEIKHTKVTVGEVYRMAIMKKNNNKLLNFKDNSDNKKDLTQIVNTEHFVDEKKFNRKNENRNISKTPFKVLDAPNLQDDFYLNLLQWSSTNILSVALQSSLYFWNANNNKVLRFCDLNPLTITSIGWDNVGSNLAIGTSMGTVEIWDTQKAKKTQTMVGHSSRVSSLEWSYNVIASGSRDRSIQIRDCRMNNSHIVSTYQGHTQEVCGLKWSHDGHSLASGGNDNKLMVWNLRSNLPVSKFSDHTAAVKAIAWSPHNHGILASGGGSVDRTIKFWNTIQNNLIDSIETGSQVCNLTFSKTTKQLVSTHGYSNNQIVIWKYPTLQKTAILTGHSSRVLFLAMNPTGQVIVTGAGDETLRFWNVFPKKAKPNFTESGSGLLSMMELR